MGYGYIKDVVYEMTVRPPPKVIVEKREGYRTIIENGVFGGHRLGFFEWIIYTDKLVADEALSSIPPDSAKAYIKRTIQCRIIRDPVEAKAFHQWLSQHIAEYEKTFGRIPVPGEFLDKIRKMVFRVLSSMDLDFNIAEFLISGIGKDLFLKDALSLIPNVVDLDELGIFRGCFSSSSKKKFNKDAMKVIKNAKNS